jgi:hypothetical protein
VVLSTVVVVVVVVVVDCENGVHLRRHGQEFIERFCSYSATLVHGPMKIGQTRACPSLTYRSSGTPAQRRRYAIWSAGNISPVFMEVRTSCQASIALIDGFSSHASDADGVFDIAASVLSGKVVAMIDGFSSPYLRHICDFRHVCLRVGLQVELWRR